MQLGCGKQRLVDYDYLRADRLGERHGQLFRGGQQWELFPYGDPDHCREYLHVESGGRELFLHHFPGFQFF